MGAVIGNLFGGGARKEARRAQAEQRVAADRQLASQQAAEGNVRLSRRNPRGRRLFADAQSNNLPSTVA